MMYKRSKCRAWNCDDLEGLRESARDLKKKKREKKNIRKYCTAKKNIYIRHKRDSQTREPMRRIIADPSETQYPRAIGWI